MTAVTDHEWSRHQATRAGHDFHDAVWLGGFDHQSIWGYDTGVRSFFAQIWINHSVSEDPDLWLTPPTFSANWPHALVPPIVTFSETDPLAVVRALGIATPDPQLVVNDELVVRRQRLLQDGDDPYTRGRVRALTWVLGQVDQSPSSTTPLVGRTRPSADEVQAEAAYATGLLTLTGDTTTAGVEAELLESLRR